MNEIRFKRWRLICYVVCILGFSWLQQTGTKAYTSGGFFKFAKYEVFNYGWPLQHLSVRYSYISSDNLTIKKIVDRRFRWLSATLNVMVAVLFASLCTLPLILIKNGQYRIWHLFAFVTAAAVSLSWVFLGNGPAIFGEYLLGRNTFDQSLICCFLCGALFGASLLLIDGARWLGIFKRQTGQSESTEITD